MPTEWQYHADGVRTALETKHDLDGSLTRVTLSLDAFKNRVWSESELEQHDHKSKDQMHYDEVEGVFEEYANGANATLSFAVDDRVATLESIEPEDGDVVEPNHMMLLPAAVRVVEGLSDVEMAQDPLETLANEYHNAADVYIEQLDG